jgi:hypothetical protein
MSKAKKKRTGAARIPSDAGTRFDRLVLVQAHVSILLILSAVLFATTAWLLTRRPPWSRVGIGLLLAAAAAGLLAALGPWLWRQTVKGQRRLIAVALIVSGGGLIAMVPGSGFGSVFGAQAALSAAILTEVGNRKGALAWFWICAFVLILPAVIYWWLVVPRPMGE